MIIAKYRNRVTNRSDLLSLLSEACEIEHGLACSYLFSAFTIKQSTEEGLSSEQMHILRKWAAQIYLVASQEMLHLAQAWNLLKAIGGTPYYFRPNFPQNSKYYSFNIPISLEPFGIETMQRFIMYELPEHEDQKNYVARTFNLTQDFDYKTVGELYRIIREGFASIPEKELFIGDPAAQIDREVVDFPELIKVVDLASAHQAIDMITEQGEGSESDRDDCHYGIFKSIDSEMRKMLTSQPGMSFSRNVVDNPQAFSRSYGSARGGNQVTNELTRKHAELFDDLYSLMLRVLQHVFDNPNSADTYNKVLGAYAIQLMVRVIKPLGEALTFMPHHPDAFSKRSGPGFGLTRHIPFPVARDITLILIKEAHLQHAHTFETLIKDENPHRSPLIPIANSMREMGRLLEKAQH